LTLSTEDTLVFSVVLLVEFGSRLLTRSRASGGWKIAKDGRFYGLSNATETYCARTLTCVSRGRRAHVLLVYRITHATRTLCRVGVCVLKNNIKNNGARSRVVGTTTNFLSFSARLINYYTAGRYTRAHTTVLHSTCTVGLRARGGIRIKAFLSICFGNWTFKT